MKKLMLLLLALTLLISGCNSEKKVDVKSTGYGNISKIEIKKFKYNGQIRTLANQRLEKAIVIDETTDLKKFYDAFNNKEEQPGIVDIVSPIYQVKIYYNDKGAVVYDILLPKPIAFHKDGHLYLVNKKHTKGLLALLYQ